MFDYFSIPPEKEWVKKHKECSLPPGVLGLAKAVIEQAIADIVNLNGRDHALGWIFCDDRNYQFSFLSCCGLIQVDPAQMTITGWIWPGGGRSDAGGAFLSSSLK